MLKEKTRLGCANEITFSQIQGGKLSDLLPSSRRGGNLGVRRENKVFKFRPFWVRAPVKFVQYIKAVVHPDAVRFGAAINSSRFLGTYIGNIHGKGALPGGNPLPAIAPSAGLMDPRAIFEGLLRPLNESAIDMNSEIYILNPRSAYVLDLDYFRDHPELPEEEKYLLIEEPVPENSALAVFGSMDQQLVDETKRIVDDPDDEVWMVVLWWEWTLADGSDSTLPHDHPNRYDKRIL